MGKTEKPEWCTEPAVLGQFLMVTQAGKKSLPKYMLDAF